MCGLDGKCPNSKLSVGSDVKEREGPLCVGGMADAGVLHIAPTYPALLCSAELYSAEL